jgi:hypothetical protein
VPDVKVDFQHDHTYGVFLPKHRRGNPGGYTPYFQQNPDGTYSLL